MYSSTAVLKILLISSPFFAHNDLNFLFFNSSISNEMCTIDDDFTLFVFNNFLILLIRLNTDLNIIISIMKSHIAIVVQEGMKDNLYKLVNTHKSFLSENHVIATLGTAEYLFKTIEFKVTDIVHSGERGGDIKIANKIVDDELDALIFLLNPLKNFPHEGDIQSLIRVCNVTNTPCALNIITADMVLYCLSLKNRFK